MVYIGNIKKNGISFPTFAGPDGPHHLVLQAEDDGGQDDGREAGPGDEGAVGHEEGQAENDQSSSVETSHGSLDSTGAVDSRPGEGPRGWH